jgi:hypothetical protein
VARWVKYIQPIFGAVNKLNGNLMELTKKYRQRHRARVAQKIRQILFRQMTSNERREYAARRIQSMYRSYRTRKVIWALNIIQGNKETLAAIKVQSVFRAKLARARKRLKRKRMELQKLQAKARMDLHLKKGKKSMNAEERKRLYELEEELQMETARILNRRMLLRPDTIFSITWKTLFVICVLVEIAGLVWNPILKKYKDKETGQSLTISGVLKDYMIPPPLSDVCVCGSEALGGGIQWHKKLLEALKLQKPKHCGPKPWFCNEPYSTAISCYSRSMVFLMDEFLVMVSIVMAVDVPVSFFTGEFNEETGVLQPKSWFQRWILPGLVLQLAVNPHLASTSRALGRMLDQIFHHIGPVRVFRWASALFYPLFLMTLDSLERNVWVHIISDHDDRKDHDSVLDEATSLVLQKQQDVQVSAKLSST